MNADPCGSGSTALVLSGNILLQLEPKLWTTVEPEPKINNFGYATLGSSLTLHNFTILNFNDPDFIFLRRKKRRLSNCTVLRHYQYGRADLAKKTLFQRVPGTGTGQFRLLEPVLVPQEYLFKKGAGIGVDYLVFRSRTRIIPTGILPTPQHYGIEE